MPTPPMDEPEALSLTEGALTLDCVIEAPEWAPLDLPARALAASLAALDHLGLADPDQPVELSLLATDDARIAALNAAFRDKGAPTNVLSWPAADLAPSVPGQVPPRPAPDFPDEPLFLGDIALSLDTCAREAASAGRPLSDHVTHLVVHGLLHLLGYDHQTEADAELMESTEVAILQGLGVPDPY